MYHLPDRDKLDPLHNYLSEARHNLVQSHTTHRVRHNPPPTLCPHSHSPTVDCLCTRSYPPPGEKCAISLQQPIPIPVWSQLCKHRNPHPVHPRVYQTQTFPFLGHPAGQKALLRRRPIHPADLMQL